MKSDLDKALEFVSSKQFKEAIRAEQDEIKQSVKQVPNNEFFQLFAAQYTRELDQTLANTYGKSVKKGQVFSDQLIKHAGQANIFRRELPGLFNSNATAANRRKVIEERLSDIAKVPLPPAIKKLQDAQKQLGVGTSPTAAEARLNTDPMKDESYVRRLKMANYGKWYLQPKTYGDKVNKINKQLRLYDENETIEY